MIYHHVNGNQRRAEGVIIILDKSIKSNNCYCRQRNTIIIIKWWWGGESIYQKDMTVNLTVPNNKGPKYMKQD